MRKCVETSSMSCYSPTASCSPRCFDSSCSLGVGCPECSGCDIGGHTWLEWANLGDSDQANMVGVKTCTSTSDGRTANTPTAASGFTISTRQYDVRGGAAAATAPTPFNADADTLPGPAGHSNKYQQPKKFYPVVDGSAPPGAAAGAALEEAVSGSGGRVGLEGVVWQDPGTLKVYVTWLNADLSSSETYELPSSSGGTTASNAHGYLIAAAGNGVKRGSSVFDDSGSSSSYSKLSPGTELSNAPPQLVYLIASNESNGDKVTPLPVKMYVTN